MSYGIWCLYREGEREERVDKVRNPLQYPYEKVGEASKAFLGDVEILYLTIPFA